PALLSFPTRRSSDLHSAQHTFFRKFAFAVVDEQQAWSGIACNINVGPTVLVKVGDNRGHPVALAQFGDARFPAHVRECPIAVIADRKSTRLNSSHQI